MAWANKGSWRGVPFGTRQMEDTGGAREIIHRYPGRATQDSESLGTHGKRFVFDAIVIGDGYSDARSELEEALNESGPGTLVHPVYGKRICVLAEPYKIVENTKAIGGATISLVFEEVDEQPAPALSLDTAGLVKIRVASVNASLDNLDGYSVDGPNFLQQAVADILAGPTALTGTLSRINNQIDAQLNLIDDISGAIDDFVAEITNLARTPAELFIKLKGLQNSIIGAIAAAGFDTSRNRGDLVNDRARTRLAVRSVNALSKFGDTLPEVEGTTVVRTQQRANQRKLVDLIEANALAETVGALSDIDIPGRDQAESVHDTINALFDRIMERGTISDETDQALRGLKAVYSLHLRRRTLSSRGLGRFTPKTTTPALALAYHLYGDSRREQEVIDVNEIDHPLFVPGDIELSIANG